MKAEECERKANDIRQAWRTYHIRQRNAWIKRQRWFGKKQLPLSEYQADVLADFSCKTDSDYKTAVADNQWYIQQAQMYAAAAHHVSAQAEATTIPKQRK